MTTQHGHNKHSEQGNDDSEPDHGGIGAGHVEPARHGAVWLAVAESLRSVDPHASKSW
jgi:hypothetical protein